MNEQELREHTVCALCRQKIGWTGLPLFWTATIARHGVKMDAVARQDGLATFLGNTTLAAMGIGLLVALAEARRDKCETLYRVLDRRRDGDSVLANVLVEPAMSVEKATKPAPL